MGWQIMFFPFKDSPNTACIVCKHFMNGERPALFVSHDDDGYWQFMCGDVHTQEDARVIALEEAFQIDESIGAVADLPYGYYCERESKESAWGAPVKE